LPTHFISHPPPCSISVSIRLNPPSQSSPSSSSSSSSSSLTRIEQLHARCLSLLDGVPGAALGSLGLDLGHEWLEVAGVLDKAFDLRGRCGGGEAKSGTRSGFSRVEFGINKRRVKGEQEQQSKASAPIRSEQKSQKTYGLDGNPLGLGQLGVSDGAHACRAKTESAVVRFAFGETAESLLKEVREGRC
jgi:hypothetical protein